MMTEGQKFMKELRAKYGDGVLTEKRVAKMVLKTKLYKLWIEDERWEMDVEVGDDYHDEMDVEFWRIERWAEMMELQREKSAEQRERMDMRRADDEAEESAEQRERDAMEKEDFRELQGGKRWAREGGGDGWLKRRKKLCEQRKMWKSWHRSKG